MLAHEWHDGPAADAPVLVLLHGWSLDRRVWAPLLPWLTPHCRVLAVDLPGHGGSAWQPGDADINTTCARLLALAPPAALWLGWSLGGLLALRLAAQHPARVRALALLAATPSFVAREDGFPALPAATFAAFAGDVAARPARTLARFRHLVTAGDADARALRHTLAALDAAATPPAADALAAGLAWLHDEDLRRELRSLPMPVQLLLGANDALVPVALAAWCAQAAPTVDVGCLPGAGHAPHLTQPKAVAAACLAQWRRHGLLPPPATATVVAHGATT